MKLLEFEIFSFVFVLIPWGAYLLITQISNILYGGVVITLICLIKNNYATEDPLPDSIPDEFSVLAGIIVFTPLILTISCFYIYDSLDDAFWVFIMSSCILGNSISGLISIIKQR